MTHDEESVHRSGAELAARSDREELFAGVPLPPDQLLDNLGLFANRQWVGRMLFMHDLYRRIVEVHGVVFEFGTRWGQNLALWANLRGIYEPYNHTRRIVGFDTFEGFVGIDEKDGAAAGSGVGSYDVSAGYEEYLERLLTYHEAESPIAHIKKFELVKGDATKTVREYLDAHPETVVALAYFDMDLYEPTKACLEAIRPHLTRGSVIGFDEAAYADWPGETIAIQEVLGIPNIRLQRSPLTSVPSFAVIE